MSKEMNEMSYIDMKHFHTIEDLQRSVVQFLFDHEANYVVVHNKFDLDSLQRLAFLSEFKTRIVLWDQIRRFNEGLRVKNFLVYGKRKEPNSDQFIEEIHDIFARNSVIYGSGKIYVHYLERNGKRNVDEDKQKLLVIELDDINAVPNVYYNGEKLDFISDLSFVWSTKEGAGTLGSASIDIEHFDKSTKPGSYKRIGHEKFS